MIATTITSWEEPTPPHTGSHGGTDYYTAECTRYYNTYGVLFEDKRIWIGHKPGARNVSVHHSAYPVKL